MNEPDADLVAKTRDGDLIAFEQLILRYERSVRSIAWAYLHDLHAGDDVTQETFLAAYRSLSGLKELDKFGPWLMQIARRTAQKHRSRESIPLQTKISVDEVSDLQPTISTRQQELLGLVERLPNGERLVVAMRFFDGYSSQEIAKATGKPLGTITKQLSRAYERLRNWFSQMEETANEQ